MKRFSTMLALLLAVMLSSAAVAQEDFDVQFNCDLTVQTAVNFFDPAVDTIDVRGSFNGWAGPADLLVEDPFTPGLYQTIERINLTANLDTIAYKFVITNSAGTQWEAPLSIPNGGDRRWGPDGNEPDLNGDGIKDAVLPTVFWGDLTADDLFLDDSTDVIFQVDMRPAHAFLADSGAITYGGGNVTSIDTVYVAGGVSLTVPPMQWVWDLTPGDPAREALQMKDDGTNGDLTPGDSVWSIRMTFLLGAPKAPKMKHGINGYDNEGGFGEDYTSNLVSVGRFHGWDGLYIIRCFGSNGTLYDSTYQALCGLDPSDPSVAINPSDDWYSQPDNFQLAQNYPNPFNPTTSIDFALSTKADVSIRVYNLMGQEIATLVNGAVNAGSHTIQWDGRDNAGNKVVSGVYIYRLRANNFTQTHKMILMK